MEPAKVRACPQASRPPPIAVRSGFHLSVATQSPAKAKKRTSDAPTVPISEAIPHPAAAPVHPASSGGSATRPMATAAVAGTSSISPVASTLQRRAEGASSFSNATSPHSPASTGSATAPTPRKPRVPRASQLPATPTTLPVGKSRIPVAPNRPTGINESASRSARARSPSPHSSRR
jgi:hypothetical protein